MSNSTVSSKVCEFYIIVDKARGMFKAGESWDAVKRSAQVANTYHVDLLKSRACVFASKKHAQKWEKSVQNHFSSSNVDAKLAPKKDGATEWFYMERYGDAMDILEKGVGLIAINKLSKSKMAWLMVKSRRKAIKATVAKLDDPKDWSTIGYVAKSGYRYMYVAGTRENKNTQLVHRVLYMFINGEIPEGYEVIFKNGDKSDIRIANLELRLPDERRKQVALARHVRAGHYPTFKVNGIDYKHCKKCGIDHPVTKFSLQNSKTSDTPYLRPDCRDCSNALRAAKSADIKLKSLLKALKALKRLGLI
jgi:HNH endonuclease